MSFKFTFLSSYTIVTFFGVLAVFFSAFWQIFFGVLADNFSAFWHLFFRRFGIYFFGVLAFLMFIICVSQEKWTFPSTLSAIVTIFFIFKSSSPLLFVSLPKNEFDTIPWHRPLLYNYYKISS